MCSPINMHLLKWTTTFEDRICHAVQSDTPGIRQSLLSRGPKYEAGTIQNRLLCLKLERSSYISASFRVRRFVRFSSRSQKPLQSIEAGTSNLHNAIVHPERKVFRGVIDC